MCLSTPKVPAPTPVIQRQPYKDPVSRANLLSGDPDARRRMIAGVATSAQGDPTVASTTKRVALGGDQQLAPVLGGGTSPTGGVTPTPDVPDGPTRPGQVGGGATQPKKKTQGLLAGFVASRAYQLVH